MPLLGILHLLIAISFVYHAHTTGRPQFWMYILIFVPVVGSLAYVLFELLPEVANSRRARKVAGNLKTVVDPDREWRRLSQQAEDTDSVDAKLKFGEECEHKGMWDQAISLYRQAARGIFADDPEVLRRLARAQLGSGDAISALSTLDDLRKAHPNYQHQDAHLTYARALEFDGRLKEAESEYRALSGYYIGLEARARYALLMQKLEEPLIARQLFGQLVKAAKARGVVLSDHDREWLKIAHKNL